MLIIRRDQKAPFEGIAHQRFVERLTQLIRDDFESEVEALSEEDVQGRIKSAIARAVERGLTWESSLYIFVSLSFAIGSHFDLHPQIRELLDEDTFSPNERVKRLPQHLTEEVWQSAARHAHNIPWDDL